MEIYTFHDFTSEDFEKALLEQQHLKHFRLTPFIITLCEGLLTYIDIETFIEMGMSVVRFKLTLTKKEKIEMIRMIQEAVKLFHEKTNTPTWPIAIALDIPNACIRTGFLRDDIQEARVHIEEDWIIEITCDYKYFDKCDQSRIYIDDPYTFEYIEVGTEISIKFGKIILTCIELIDSKTIKCKVLRGDDLGPTMFVCIRGVPYKKPSLTKIDLNNIEFAKEYKFDVIIINSLRKAQTLQRVRKMFDNEKHKPLIMGVICEQEGLDNIDEIIEASDGIILAREFLAQTIVNTNKMMGIQLNVGGKCRKRFKPFFVSGNILETTLHRGTITDSDISDITNAVLQGSGFLMRSYYDTKNVLRAMSILNEICKSVESLTQEFTDLWRIIDEYKMPINAAEGCIIASASAAKLTNSAIIVVLTVTGETARLLSQISPTTVVLSVSVDPAVTRRLQLNRGLKAIIYENPPVKDWFEEMNARINYGIDYAVKYSYIKYGEYFTVLRRASQYSSFCDSVSIRTCTSRIDQMEC